MSHSRHMQTVFAPNVSFGKHQRSLSASKRLPTFFTAVAVLICVDIIRALRSMFSAGIGVHPLTRPADVVFPPCDV